MGIRRGKEGPIRLRASMELTCTGCCSRAQTRCFACLWSPSNLHFVAVEILRLGHKGLRGHLLLDDVGHSPCEGGHVLREEPELVEHRAAREEGDKGPARCAVALCKSLARRRLQVAPKQRRPLLVDRLPVALRRRVELVK
eukprot:4845314-Pleurochrysis_carterae.AAC.2